MAAVASKSSDLAASGLAQDKGRGQDNGPAQVNGHRVDGPAQGNGLRADGPVQGNGPVVGEVAATL